MKNYMNFFSNVLIIIVLSLVLPNDTLAGMSKIPMEISEYIMKNFGKEVAEYGGQKAIEKSVKGIVAKYGSNTIPIIKKYGLSGIKFIDDFGEDGIRLLGSKGDKAFVALKKSGREIIPLANKYGDDVLSVCIKHPGVGENIIKEYGNKGLKIAKNLNTQNIIKILHMKKYINSSNNQAKKIIDIILEYGEKAVDHLDRHKMLYFVAVPSGYNLTKLGCDFVDNPTKYFSAPINAIIGGSSGERGIIDKILILGTLLIAFRIFLWYKRKKHT